MKTAQVAWSQFAAKNKHSARQTDTSGATAPDTSHSIGIPSLRTLPPDSSSAEDTGAMNVNLTSPPPAGEQVQIPRRNLSEAFEELYVATEDSPSSTNAVTPAMKQADEKAQKPTNLISPTGVADLHVPPPPATPATDATTEPSLPIFKLHKDLQRDLSQPVICRVSFYAIIHDINKEASAMAANDDSGLNRAASSGGSGEDITEDHSPLVEAVKGPCANPPTISSNMIQAALIDEEKWLLSAIEMRGDDENRPMQACPPTFLQAMGEREYENPLTSLSSGSRTQLWKPSRSWWEAKSGKNPWIEPKSHNKRWRYLWPLIHYHKFLAKCIKKLKRNGVDVKMSVSPVAAFLREEVCAVSDHLAAVSMFDSEEWMSCLRHFSGWTNTSPESEANLRVLVSKLYLRPLAEHGDIESPLLRSQIDEQFLKAMAAARSQMDLGSEQERFKPGGKPATQRPAHPRGMGFPMEPLPPHMQPVPNHVGGPPRGTGVRRPRYPYGGHQWWGQNGWHQAHHQYNFGDDASVHSSLSGDAFQEYASGAYPVGQFYPQMYHPHAMEHPHAYDMLGDPSMYPMHTPYHHDHAGYYGHPIDTTGAYTMHHPQPEDTPAYYGMADLPTSPEDQQSPAPTTKDLAEEKHGNEGGLTSGVAGDRTPYKHNAAKTPRSPYWGHLDRAIAMGLATPQTHIKSESAAFVSPEEASDGACLGNAQPLLLRQSQYYGYGPVSNYPPSPATQFMMSPQANFAYNYGYGYSHSPAHGHGHVPSHYKQSPHGYGTNRSASLKQAAHGYDKTDDRVSPSTVETITESETISTEAT